MADPVSIFANIAIAVATTAISNALAPTQKFEGPRLDELRVQTSTLGKFRPIPFGTIAYAGNVLWLENNALKETKHKESSGKGGPKVENTTYTYSASFAVGFGEGEIGGALRILADSVLIYDKTNSDIETVYEGEALFKNLTVYPGSETQDVNPRIEADDPNTSAYRGEAYIVFEDFQLEKFGNRIPNITVELFTGTGTTAPESTETYDLAGPARQYRTSAMYFDEANAALTLFRSLGDVNVIADIGVYRVHLNGVEEYLGAFDVGPDYPGLYGASLLDGWADSPVMAQAVSASLLTVFNANGFVAHTCNGVDAVAETGQYFQRGSDKWAVSEVTANTVVQDVSGIYAETVYTSTTATPTGKLHTMFPGENVIFAFTVSSQLVCFDYDWNVLWSVDMSSESITVTHTVGGTDAILRTETDDEVLLYWNRKFWRIDEFGFTYLGTSSGTKSYEEHGGHHYVNGLFIYYKDEHNELEIINVETGLAKYSEPLTSVIDKLRAKTWLQASDIDTTALTGLSVDGYVITSLGTLKSATEPLQLAYLVDVIESEYKLKFKLRGGASVVTIPESDLAAHEYGQERPQPLPVIRTKESALPQKTKVGYISEARDYEPDMQESERVVTDSDSVRQIDLSLVLTDDRAAELAEIYQQVAWIERNQYPEFSLPYKYAYLESSDVVDIEHNGATHSVRIEEHNIGRPGIVQCKGVAQKAAHYTSNAAGNAGQASTQTIGMTGPTNLILMDIPLLRDADNDSGFYIAAGGFYSAWPGCVVMKSADNGESYSQVQSILNESTIGFLTATPTTGDTTVIDTENTINVSIYNGGTLSSVSQLAMFSGENAAAIGLDGRWVIIKFQTATLEGDGSYTLSNIMWGYQGTEHNLSTLAADDTFVLLSEATLIRTPANDDEIGLERHYKGVTLGKNQDSAFEIAFTNNANSLEPYSPVHIKGSIDGSDNWDIDAKWRTRVGGAWRDSVDATQGESPASFEIDIMDGATVKRTLTGSSFPIEYSSANQITDWGSNQTSIEVNVYQISATTGRGHVGNATL